MKNNKFLIFFLIILALSIWAAMMNDKSDSPESQAKAQRWELVKQVQDGCIFKLDDVMDEDGALLSRMQMMNHGRDDAQQWHRETRNKISEAVNEAYFYGKSLEEAEEKGKLAINANEAREKYVRQYAKCLYKMAAAAQK